MIMYSVAIQLDVAAGIFAEQDAVADLHVQRDNFAVFRLLPLPTAMTSPSCGFSLAESGMYRPPCMVSSSSNPFHHDPVIERTNFHTQNLQFSVNERFELELVGPGLVRPPSDTFSTLLPRVTRSLCK